MYVLCSGMYRACSTWQYEVIAHLLERYRDGHRLGYLTGEEFEARDAAEQRGGGWWVLKSHEGHRSFARAVARRRAVTVYAHRDIRDVVFSLMHKRGVTFEKLLRQGMIHQILVNDRFWSTRPNVLIQRYEWLVANPAEGVLQIAAHLGIAIDPEEASEIASEYSFQTNRRRMKELVERLRDQGVDLDDPSNLQYYDQKTLLHWNHLREGRPGNWREQATPAQRAVLSRLCDGWLIAHGYEADTIDPQAGGQRLAASVRREADLARAWLVCALRCASLRYPRMGGLIKQMLGIPEKPAAATPARIAPQHRVDGAQPAPDATSSRGAEHPARDGYVRSAEESSRS